MKNVTVSLPEETARWVRVEAAKADRSVSAWLADLLNNTKCRSDDYDDAMEPWSGVWRSGHASWRGSTAARPPARSCMTAPVFVDTDVLVYRHDSTDPVKQARAQAWYEFVWRRLGRLSFQVLQELCATLTRKLVPQFDVQEARALVRDLAAWQPVAPDLAPAGARLATGVTLLAVMVGRHDRRRRAERRLPRLADGGPQHGQMFGGRAGDRPVRVAGAAAGGAVGSGGNVFPHDGTTRQTPSLLPTRRSGSPMTKLSESNTLPLVHLGRSQNTSRYVVGGSASSNTPAVPTSLSPHELGVGLLP